MELVGIVEPPAAAHLLEDLLVMAVSPQAVADRFFQSCGRDHQVRLRNVGDQVDVVLAASDGLHRGADRRGALRIDQYSSDQRIIRVRQPATDAFVPILSKRELGVTEFQSLAEPLKDTDELCILQVSALINKHFSLRAVSPDPSGTGIAVVT